MKYLFSIVVFLFCLHCFSQTNFIKHKVSKGETVTQIAKEYQISAAEIYKYNPEAQNVLSVDSILIIPTKNNQFVNGNADGFFEYEVKNQETLYGISKKWGVSVDLIEKSNPDIALGGGLKVGAVLKIPTTKHKVVSESIQLKSDTLFHLVKTKETPFGVAKQYGISVKTLYELNPEAERSFNVDDKIIIKINQKATSVVIPKSESKPKTSEGTYLVQPKETLYSLTQKLGCSEKELLALNPGLKNGLNAGDYIKVPQKAKISFKKNAIVDLTKTIDIYKKNKDLVLLIPFNIKKIEADSTQKIQDRFKKDLFLNMSLDFYSGALMAIDSVKKLGISMNIKILDSEETANFNNISNILLENDFSNVGAIVGPFYPQHVAETAKLVSKEKIPVFSPLRELNSTIENGYETVVKASYLREFMYQFINKENSRILAAVDNSKSETYHFLTQKKNIKLLPHTEKGNIIVDSIAKYLKPKETNYVILDSKKTSYILSLINGLSKYSTEFDIKLVTLEKNDALDFEEINIRRLANLNLMYPSQVHDANYTEMNAFSLAYKKKHNSNPSLFAIRGFDVTLDIILRMAQKEELSETLKTMVSEHIYGKFDYTNSPTNQNNQGVYIQQYQDDLTIKTINN